MANTLMTAKNTFSEGLIMDFAPDNTQATCLTSALNATLLTFNGNEMSLQNDMGNGRVETARLPEGYIPMGSCEFGDIIYIVSYNPLSNKAQIGCFPSPERNITSNEMSDLIRTLNSSDFQEMSGGQPTGTFKKTSVKKVLIESKKLNPGDKYIIYSNQANSIENNSSVLSDYGMGEHNVLPKAVKLHVVSIEDTGKITYLDTTTKWYDDYYVKEGAVTIQGGETDLDSYRSLISSEWSIFSSKVPGKLAILAELETIDSFSCSYSLEGGNISDSGNIKKKEYSLHLEPSYEGKEGIETPFVSITEGYFAKSSEGQSDNYVSYQLANEEKKVEPATSFIANPNQGWPYSENIDTEIDFSIPYKQILTIDGKTVESPINSNTFIYNFSVVPIMGNSSELYGRLDHLKVDLSIDFNKIGTGEADFYTWKYHNSEETSILTYGVNTYPKPGYEVKFIQMDFYDNQGPVAQYILDGKKSYNGIFNEYINLEGQSSNTRLSRYKLKYAPGTEGWDNSKKPSEQEKEVIKHKAEEITSIDGMFEDDYKIEDTKYYRNDAGTLYYGALYAVRITVWQSNKSGTIWDNSQSIVRWYWTSSMFNEYYYNTKDFGTLNFELVLDSKTLFAIDPSTYIWQNQEINNLGNDFGDTDHYKTYSANVQYIGRDFTDNIKMYVQAGLQNDYGCFNLINKTDDSGYNDLQKIQTDIYLSTAQIDYNIPGDQYEFSDNTTNVTDPIFLSLNSQKINDGMKADFGYVNGTAINTEIIKKDGLKDSFNVNFNEATAGTKGTLKKNEGIKQDDDTYIYCDHLQTTLYDCYYQDDANKAYIPLSMSAVLYNKTYTQNIYSNNVSVPVYTPIISSEEDFGSLGLGVMWEDNSSLGTSTGYQRYYRSDNGQIKMGFLTAMCIGQYHVEFTGVNFQREGLTFTRSLNGDDRAHRVDNGDREINTSSDKEYLETVWAPISEQMGKFFLVYPGGRDSTNKYGITEGLYNYPSINDWYIRQKGGLPQEKTRNDNSTFVYQGAYDIDSKGLINKTSSINKVGFLAMKHDKGFTLLNQAFYDYWYEENYQEFQQSAYYMNNSPMEYENFAYHLYLILSNTFHKNKRIEDTTINLRNYVRNGNYDVTLTKNIVVKLSEDEDNNKESNIAMRGMDFVEYRDAILKQFSSEKELNYLQNESPNARLKFLSSAVNNVLTLNVKSQPLQFVITETDAYILYNGMLIPTFNLADNTFYIYQEGKLQQFQNKQLKFNIKDVENNIRYLFSSALPELENFDSPIKLRGVHPPKQKSLTPFQEAYNSFVDQVRIQMQEIQYSEGFVNGNRYKTAEEVNDMKNNIISTVLSKLPRTINGVNKYELHSHALSQTVDTIQSYPEIIRLGAYEVYFRVQQYQDSTYPDQSYWTLNIMTGATMEKEVTLNDATEYTFTTQFNLRRLFDYENNALVLKSNAVSNIFGIKDAPKDENYKCAYTGFIKDVIVDTTFQIAP